MAIDFSLSDAQRDLQAGARAFAENILRNVHATIATIQKPEDRFYATRPFYKEMANVGFVKALIPKAFGGTGLSTLDFAIAAEELAAEDINVPSTLLGTGLGLEPIIQFGSQAQKQRFLPDFVRDGELLASLASTEVTGGANYDSPDPSVGVRT